MEMIVPKGSRSVSAATKRGRKRVRKGLEFYRTWDELPRPLSSRPGQTDLHPLPGPHRQAGWFREDSGLAGESFRNSASKSASCRIISPCTVRSLIKGTPECPIDQVSSAREGSDRQIVAAICSQGALRLTFGVLRVHIYRGTMFFGGGICERSCLCEQVLKRLSHGRRLCRRAAGGGTL